MSIHFSLVTVTANGYEAEFYAANTPWSRDDLEENDHPHFSMYAET